MKDGGRVHSKTDRMSNPSRKRINQASRSSRDSDQTFNGFSDLICVLDRDSRITHVNSSFSRHLKRPYKKIIGSHCYEILHGTRKPVLSCPFKTVMQTGQSMRVAGDFVIGDGLYTAELVPFFNAAGDLDGAIHIFRQVNEKKNDKNISVQSEKMAAIGTLAAEMAHEINNPLHYINNYLYLISESLPADFSNRDYLDKIQMGLDNLAVLTRDLLEFARPRLDVLVPVDVHRNLDSSIEMAAKTISEKRIRIIKQYQCIEKQVLGSDEMLHQLFLNVVQNALDAMATGGSLTIKTSCTKNLMTLKFEDTGVGIPKKIITQIFDPFFTTKKNAPKRGTGLGLTICYNVVKQLQGDIMVSSKEGVGTTFTMTLPAVSQIKQ